jgi:hypothetical protein
MKCIFFSLAFFITLFTCFSSFAQLEQGTFVVNERFDFSTTTSESNSFNYSSENKQTRFSTTTSFGYLFKENQEIGVLLVYGRDKISSQENGFDNDATRQNYGFGIYYKRYVTIIDKLSFFVAPQLDYLSTKYSGSEYNGNQIGANIYTGILYRPTQKFGLSMNLVGAGINYSYRKQSVLKQNSFSLSNVGGLNLGLQFMF